MDGLDSLGAIDALSTQTISLRIKHIDRNKLTRKLGGATGTLATAGLQFSDAAPKAVLDMVIPVVKTKLMNDYGVETEITHSDAPLPTGKALSEFFPGLTIGLGLGLGLLAIVKGVTALVGR